MPKDFSDWHTHKIGIDATQRKPLYFAKREVWWAAIGLNIGSEVDGKTNPTDHAPYTRPILIVKSMMQGAMFYGIPLSTQLKPGYFYHQFTFNKRLQVALLNQFKACDSRRLIKKMGSVSEADFQDIIRMLHTAINP